VQELRLARQLEDVDDDARGIQDERLLDRPLDELAEQMSGMRRAVDVRDVRA